MRTFIVLLTAFFSLNVYADNWRPFGFPLGQIIPKYASPYSSDYCGSLKAHLIQEPVTEFARGNEATLFCLPENYNIKKPVSFNDYMFGIGEFGKAKYPLKFPTTYDEFTKEKYHLLVRRNIAYQVYASWSFKEKEIPSDIFKRLTSLILTKRNIDLSRSKRVFKNPNYHAKLNNNEYFHSDNLRTTEDDNRSLWPEELMIADKDHVINLISMENELVLRITNTKALEETKKSRSSDPKNDINEQAF